MDIVELLLKESEITPAQYWEAQASMWQENYKDAANEIERLREALEIAADGFRDCGAEDLEDMCRAVIAKVKGEE